MTNIIDSELRAALGIDGSHLTPVTYFGWLLELARQHGLAGLRYAVGMKINRAIDRNRDGGFIFHNEEFEGFRWLVIEVLSWNDINSDNLRALLTGEYAWANRYLKGLVPESNVSAPSPLPPPPSPWNLNMKLAHDFDGAGLRYALRYFTSPIHTLEEPMCVRCSHYFRNFVEEIRRGGGATASAMESALLEPEFSRYVHYLDDSDDSEIGTILEITT